MSIIPKTLYPPHPSTARAQSLHISYDSVNDRIAYPSGKSIIVRPLNPHSTTPAKQFTKHIYATTVATFSPSGNYIASGDETGQVKIWDTSISTEEGSPFEQPRVKSEFQILSGPIKAIAWDADNARVIAVGQGKDKFGHCFTWDSGNSIGEIQGHSASINAVAIKSQRPYRAATVGDDKALVFFNGPPFKFDKSLRGHHTNTVRDVKFSPDGKWLVSAGSDRIIVIYDGKTGEYLDKIEAAHNGGIYGISWLADSTEFVTASADGTLKSWDIETKKSVHTYVIDAEPGVANQQVGVVVTNKCIVSLSFNGNLNYFLPGNGELHKVLSGNQTALTALKLADSELYTGSSNGPIFKWKVKTEGLDPVAAALGAVKDRHSNYVVSIASNGKQIITSGWDDKLKVWEGDENTSTVDLGSQPKKVIEADAHTIVLFENKIQLYKDNEVTFEIPLKFNSNDADFLDGKLVVTNVTGNTIEEYNVGATEITKTSSEYPKLRSPPSLVRFSPDGKYIAVADTTGKYTVYGTADFKVVTTRWAFHSSKVYDAKWTPDSQFLLSGGLDSGIFIYSIERPAKVLKFPLAHQNGVSGVEWLNYAEDKADFATVGLDGVLKTWEVKFAPK